jgi:hypothetical protein
MFEIKLEPTKRFTGNPADRGAVQVITIHTQTWVKGSREYIIVHQDNLYNIYWRPKSETLVKELWSDLLPQPVHDLLSIRCAIEELGILPEEEVL